NNHVSTLDLFGDIIPSRNPMAEVRFEPSGRTIRVERGTPLLEAARGVGLPVAQSCGGFAICSWCRMQVLSGWENLSPIEPSEARLIQREDFAGNERASCQAEVLGDVTVTTRYW
ncbi:MAG: 2Fe-2S iron-sulfur cluster-binding protein, partial [Bacteroidota bacterium]